MKIITLKNKVMFGIYTMFVLNKLKSPLVGETSTALLMVALLSLFVSVPSVFSNMFSSPSISRYFMIAFSNTTLVVQLMVIMSVLVAVKAAVSISHLSSVGRARLS